MAVRLMRIRLLPLVGILILAGCLAVFLWGLDRVTDLQEVVLYRGYLEPVCDESTGICRPPWGMVVDGEGTIYITDSWARTLMVLGPEGEKINLSFEEGVIPSFPALAAGRLFFFDQGSARLRSICIEELPSADDAGVVPVDEGVPLASTLGEMLAGAGYTADEDDDDEPAQVILHRLEGVGSALFVFCDLVMDRAIHRVAVEWQLVGESEDVTWIYLAETGESAGGWRETIPDDRVLGAAAVDVSPAGFLRSQGGDLLWQVQTPGGDFLWRSHHPVMPHLVGGKQNGLWIAERRPAAAAGLGVTAFSSEWTMNWITPGGELLQTVRISWPGDWRSGPTAAVHGDTLYLLHPEGGGQVTVRSLTVRTQLSWRLSSD